MKEKELSFADLLFVIKKYKKEIIRFNLIVIFLCLCVCLSSVFLPESINFLPNKFTATSLIKINGNDSSSGLSNMISSSGMGAMAGLMGISVPNSNSNAAWAIELAKSRTVLDQISKEFDLQKIYSRKSKHPIVDTRKSLLENLVIEENEDTGSLVIKYTDINKKLAADIVNKFVDILEKSFKEIDSDSNKNKIDLIFQKIQNKENLILTLVNDLTSFQVRNNIIEPYVMSSELTKQIMQLRSAVNLKESELDFAKDFFSSNSPKVINKELELESAKRLLADLESGKGSAEIPSLQEMPLLLVEYEKKKTYIEAQRTIYSGLLQEYELIKLRQSGTSATFQVIEKAEVPLIKSKPSRGKICIVVAFISFFFSIIISFIKDFCFKLQSNSQRTNK